MCTLTDCVVGYERFARGLQFKSISINVLESNGLSFDKETVSKMKCNRNNNSRYDRQILRRQFIACDQTKYYFISI